MKRKKKKYKISNSQTELYLIQKWIHESRYEPEGCRAKTENNPKFAHIYSFYRHSENNIVSDS